MPESRPRTRFIFVTGGVVSSLGKGIAAASIGRLLVSRGLTVAMVSSDAQVRALDVSAFDPVGVNQNKMRFLEVFLALCLMKDSPPIATWEHEVLDGLTRGCGPDDGSLVVAHGRDEAAVLTERRPSHRRAATCPARCG